MLWLGLGGKLPPIWAVPSTNLPNSSLIGGRQSTQHRRPRPTHEPRPAWLPFRGVVPATHRAPEKSRVQAGHPVPEAARDTAACKTTAPINDRRPHAPSSYLVTIAEFLRQLPPSRSVAAGLTIHSFYPVPRHRVRPQHSSSCLFSFRDLPRAPYYSTSLPASATVIEPIRQTVVHQHPNRRRP